MEGGAFAGGGFDFYRAADLVDDFLGRREAESGAAVVLRGVERFEDLVSFFVGGAGAVVGDG